MKQLTQEFVDQCSVESGYRLRGEAMTRIEVFVSAAFAFAITMLVISIDQIPNSVPALIEVSKQIPAFVLSAVQLMWIWQTHALWSKRFGLEDGLTIFISSALVIIVLIFIYPLKMMFSGLFAWLTDGFLPSQFTLSNYEELRYLFVYFALVFSVISLIFLWMHQHALNLKDALLLSREESFQLQTYIYIRWSLVVVGVLALIAPLLAADKWLPFTGFVYALIGLCYYFIETRREKTWNSLQQAKS